MAPHVCSIVPPYLLKSIVDSTSNEIADSHRVAAQFSLDCTDAVNSARVARFQALTAPRGSRAQRAVPQAIVPDYVLKHIAESGDDPEIRAKAQRDLEHIQQIHLSYQQSQQAAGGTGTKDFLTAAKAPSHIYRAVYDAKHNDDENALPGALLRAEGQKAVSDGPCNEAYDNVGHVLDFYASIFDWHSIDNKNMHVLSSVHYAKDYENAFWDPDKMQMVFGDGHDFLYHFTKCLDVIGHELTHAVTEHTAPLDYEGESGALNEHVSDVFGIMVKQRVENQTAKDADWLIGEGCLLPDVKGVALRSMKAPGTAYNDPRFGSDPQPDNYSGYKPMSDDNGGVHVYSGIPNRAFYLAAVAFGGYSWEKAGQVWWKALKSSRIPPKSTFLQFADVTVETANELYGRDGAKIVRQAWTDVGVARSEL